MHTNQDVITNQESSARRIPKFREMQGIEELVSNISQKDARGKKLAFVRLHDLWKTEDELARYIFGSWGFTLSHGDLDPKSAKLYLQLVEATADWLDTDQHDKAGDMLYALTDLPPINRSRQEFMNKWTHDARFIAIHRLLPNTPQPPHH